MGLGNSPKVMHTSRVSWTINTNRSDVIEIHESDTGLVNILSTFNGKVLKMFIAPTRGGAFKTVKDAGTIQTITVDTGTWHKIPAAVMTGHTLKFGTTANQKNTRTLLVAQKA